MSLDGYIAGPGDDLAWLEQPDAPDPADGEGQDHGFTTFLAQSAALLMGRRTYDVVAGMGLPWPYGDTPVYVATHRPLDHAPATVRAISGTLPEILERIAAQSPGRVYVDGGVLVSSTLAAGLLDEITVTLVPIVLGGGVPLFDGGQGRHPLELTDSRILAGGLCQLSYRTRGADS